MEIKQKNLSSLTGGSTPQESRNYLEIINNFATSILNLNSVDEVLWEVSNNVIGKMGFEDCVIYTCQEQDKVLTQRAAFGPKNPYGSIIKDPIKIPIGQGITGSVALTGTGEIIANTVLDERYIVDDNQRMSEICVPIKYGNNVIGVIDSEHSQPNFFTEEHFNILTTIASMVAIKMVQAEAREKIAQHNDNLEALVEKRSQKILTELKIRKETEEQLLAIQEALEASNRQLGKANDELKKFAYVVSHDLKAPLRAIGSLSDIMLLNYENQVDGEGQEMLRLIKDRAKRLHEFVNGLLSYAQIGYKSTHLIPVNLSDLVPDIVDSLEIPAHIRVDIPEDLPVVLGEKIQLRQLFQNLIHNAIKFNDKENGLIKIRHRKEGIFWQITIEDNGPGIDPKYHQKIFEIFQTLTSRDEENSTGIGLSLVKKIVEQNGGKIWVNSLPRAGTAFTFTLLET